MSENKRNRVFISYAHTDNESDNRDRRWLDRLLEQLEPLREARSRPPAAGTANALQVL